MIVILAYCNGFSVFFRFILREWGSVLCLVNVCLPKSDSSVLFLDIFIMFPSLNVWGACRLKP